MDEPTASLDPARHGELGETLVQLTAAGRTLIVATHDDDFARDFTTRVVILAEGEVVEGGDPRQVLTNPQPEGHEASVAVAARSITGSAVVIRVTTPSGRKTSIGLWRQLTRVHFSAWGTRQ
jgi:energy-coupling factor transporter ATP-binding protein EcfA2